MTSTKTPSKPLRTFRPTRGPNRDREKVVGKIIAVIEEKGWSFEASCAEVGVSSRQVRQWQTDDPAFKARVHDALEVSLEKRRRKAEAVVQDCMLGDDKQLALKAAQFFLETQAHWSKTRELNVRNPDSERPRLLIPIDRTVFESKLADAKTADELVAASKPGNGHAQPA